MRKLSVSEAAVMGFRVAVCVLLGLPFCGWAETEQPALKGRPKLRSRAMLNRPVAVDSEMMTRMSQSSPSRSTLGTGTDPSPSPSASFLALNDNATTAPPDTSGAVGPTHLVVALQSEVRYQSRTGASLFRTNLVSFWAGLAAEVFDPRVVYDPYGQRFIMTAAGETAGVPTILIAVSLTSNPEQGWHRFSDRTDLSNPVLGDSPMLGFNKNWIVVQANMFNKSTFDFFRSEVYVYNKTNLYNGIKTLRRLAFDPEDGGSQAPAIVMDSALHPLHLVMDWNGAVTNISGTIVGGYLRVFNVGGPIGNERLITTNTAGQPIFIRLGGSGWESFAPGDEDYLPQLGATNKIYAGDSRIQSLMYREGLLWTAHTVFVPAVTPTRAAVQWWAFTPGGTIIQSGAIDDPSAQVHYAYPSIAVNQDTDVLVGYSRFSGAQHASANYSFRAWYDAFGLLRDDLVLKEGEGPYRKTVNGLTRWGDWSAAMVDPVNDTDLWTIQQYANGTVEGTDRWGTWWGRASPPTDLAVTVSDSPDPVTATQNITYSVGVTNKQEQVVSGAQVQMTLAPATSFISATPSQGSCSHANGIVTCTFGTMTQFATASVSVVVRANVAGFATNVVVVSANGPDADSTDNTVNAVTDVRPSADLMVQATGSPSFVHGGNNVTYTMTVSNRGPSAASGVSLVDTVPSAMSIVSVNASQGIWTVNSGVVTFTVGSITSGGTATFTIVATANGSGMMTNRAQVSASTTDLNSANNLVLTQTRVNARPTISAIGTQNFNEDTSVGVPFTVGDVETVAGSLQVVASSSNQSVIPNSGLAVTGTGGSKTLTITPAAHQSGNNITITITVTDADGGSTSANFVANVAAVNDTPTISNINDLTIAEDGVAGPVSFTVNDVDNAPGSLTPSAVSSNPTLVPASGISFGGSGSGRTITVRPAANQFGTATITVTISDGAASASDAFTLTVSSVNDLPVISAIGSQTTDEDTATGQLSFTISDVEDVPLNLNTTATSSNPTLVPAGGLSISGTTTPRQLVVTPARDQFGSATITVSVTDRNGGTTNTSFLLTVQEINDPPRLDAIAALNSTEEAGRLTVNLTGISSGTANESQTLVVTATLSRPDLVTNVAVNYTSPNTTGTLTFDTIPEAFGSGTVTVTVDDGGSVNRTTNQVFTLFLAGVNDPPTLDPIAARTIDEDASEQSILLTGISEGPPNERNQTLTIIPSSSDSNLISNLAVDFVEGATTGTLRFTPAANANGTATITLTLNDARPTNAISTRAFTVQVLPVNDLPTISSIPAQRINEDATTAALSFTIGDVETAAASLGLVGTSSNSGLVSDGNIKFGGGGTTRDVTVQPTPNMSGVATITIRVTDAEGGSNITSFELTVDPVNDPPTLATLPAIAIDEDSGERVITLSGISAGPADENGQSLVVRATSSNPAVVPHPTVEYISPNSAGLLRLSPVLNATGTVMVAVSIQDSLGGELAQNFQLTVLPVNDLPTISQFTDQTMDEDSALVLPFQINDVETASGALRLTAFSSNPDLVADSGLSFGGAGSDRTLTIRPITNEFGAAFISVIVTDEEEASVEIGFFLTINESNDPPVISAIADQTIDEDTILSGLVFQINDPETPPAGLTLTPSSSHPALIADSAITFSGTGRDRTLMIQPATNAFGTASITLTVRDGNGVSVETAFQLTVNSVNDRPTLDPINDLTVLKNSGAHAVNLTGIGFGPTNENQALVVSAQSSNPGVVPNPTVDYTSPGPSGTLTFTPAPETNGTATITVTVSDGASFNGSISQTFDVFIQVVDPPPLVIRREADNQVSISWPATGFFRLQGLSEFPGTWTDLSVTATLNGTNYNVMRPASLARRFYRLRN